MEINIRKMKLEELDEVANLISTGYYDDIFFNWVVANDEDRHKIVTDYYKIYIKAKGSVVHVAETSSKKIIGATVWLPHDVDVSIYDDIDKAAGIYSKQFRAVADKSHYSEPPMTPFYQLVGFVISKEIQGLGIGSKLLGHQIELFDNMGISTYLEASTPYNGTGVYSKFGYQPVGELMVFDDTAVLYPLWRHTKKKEKINFGEYSWLLLERQDDKMLLLSENVIEHGKYNELCENVTWSDSSVRKYLNNTFYNKFTELEKSQIIDSQVINNDNPWFSADGGKITTDKVFLLSVEETVKYFGDSGELKKSKNKFFIDDIFNDDRKATFADNLETRWLLRTPGNSSDFVSIVTLEGKISMTGDFVNRCSTKLFNVGIRPAMWIKQAKEK